MLIKEIQEEYVMNYEKPNIQIMDVEEDIITESVDLPELPIDGF